MNGHSQEVIESFERCEICDRNFPDHLISQMVLLGGRPDVCPLCALEAMNQVHGMIRTEFGGEMANEMLYEARAFLTEEADGTPDS
ncbi:hypothetical protein LCGC14_2423240 [marine sediment metagenome]|uniref:Uncharacterized protein n=1 Tax=marine sediment metagenome TaxID=412755 RepID=A0A0F9EIA1_9ZZZZ